MRLCSFAAMAASPSGRVDDLLKQMTLEEKIGQLAQVGGVAFIPNMPKPEDEIRKGSAGSVLWVYDPAAINKLQKIAVEESRLKIPILFGLDVIHGFKTIFPMPLALAASGIRRDRTGAVRRGARSACGRYRLDIRADGGHCTRPAMGPHYRRCGRRPVPGRRSRASTSARVSRDRPGAPDRLLACAKHFAGYGAAEGGRDYDSAYIPESQLRNVYLPPFRAAAAAGAGRS